MIYQLDPQDAVVTPPSPLEGTPDYTEKPELPTRPSFQYNLQQHLEKNKEEKEKEEEKKEEEEEILNFDGENVNSGNSLA